MNQPAFELEHGATLASLLETHFRAWMEAESTGPRSAVLRRAWERALLEPGRYVAARQGKQFRARLVTTSYSLANGDPDALPEELPLVVEILHAGSLVVDDVQDGSELRRGAPTLHRVVGTPLAINTGNLFYCWAIELLSTLGLPPERELEMTRRTSSSMLRCHHGQALDLSVRVHEHPQHAIPSLVQTSTRLKAGTLMELAAGLGAVAAGGDDDRVGALCDFGRALGTSLQMLDDLSGLLNERRRNKAVEDLRLSRPTWAWSWLARDLDGTAFGELQAQAREVANGAEPEPLIAIMAERLRGPGRERVHANLQRALTAVRAELGASSHLAALQQEVERLERSYV